MPMLFWRLVHALTISVTNNVKKFCPNATIIHVDIDPTSISKTINAHIPVVGLVDIVIEQLLDELNAQEYTVNQEANEQWWQQIEQWRALKSISYQQDERKNQTSARC